jgi:hypothetical protein
VLDIAENSVNAGATRVRIDIAEDSRWDRFELRVEDDGKGMDFARKEGDRYYTEKAGKRFGLGIPLLEHAAVECDGGFEIRPAGERGTVVSAWFRRSHVDLKPLGDMGSTMSALVGGHPEIDYVFRYEKDGSSYVMDTAELKSELDGAPVNLPTVLQFIRDDVNEGIRRTKG